MIFRILFICILFAFIAPVSANQVDFRNDETLEESFLPPGAVFDPSWMMCKQAKDCTAIEGPCETFLPINKKYRREGKKFYEALSERVKCPEGMNVPIPKNLGCLQGQCAVTAQ